MVEIDTKLYNDIKLYCKVNNLKIKDFINKLLKRAFTIEKYGEKPFANTSSSVIITPFNIVTNSTPVNTCAGKKLVENKFITTEISPEIAQTLPTKEEQAVEKIKDLIENQVSVPAEIMEAVDEHFFELLGDTETEKKEKKTTEIKKNETNKKKKRTL